MLMKPLTDKYVVLPMPIIDHEYRYIYYQVPKVGCTTIKAMLAKVSGNELINDDPHDTPYYFLKLEETKKPEYEEYFKFAFIRNPVERLESCWRDKICERLDLQRQANEEHDTGELAPQFARYTGLRRNMSFTDFADYITQVPDPDSDEHFISQHRYLTDVDGYWYPDYTLRLEHLSNYWGFLTQRLGFPPLPLEHRMKTKRDIMSTRLDDGVYQRVIKRYELDMELWKLAQDPNQKPARLIRD